MKQCARENPLDESKRSPRCVLVLKVVSPVTGSGQAACSSVAGEGVRPREPAVRKKGLRVEVWRSSWPCCQSEVVSCVMGLPWGEGA